jgi:hypothetical protein
MSPSNVNEPIFDVETERRAPSAYLRFIMSASTRTPRDKAQKTGHAERRNPRHC